MDSSAIAAGFTFIIWQLVICGAILFGVGYVIGHWVF